jgi:hypothetical protein
MDKIREAFEEWYGKGYPRSIEFPEEYSFYETQNAWLAFRAGYESGYEVVLKKE